MTPDYGWLKFAALGEDASKDIEKSCTVPQDHILCSFHKRKSSRAQIWPLLPLPHFLSHVNRRAHVCQKGIPSRELTYPPKNGILKMIFLFPRWDMLIPWRVITFSISIIIEVEPSICKNFQQATSNNAQEHQDPHCPVTITSTIMH